MLFTEHVSNELSILSKRYEIDMLKASSYAELAFMEAAINIHEADLKVFTESGGNDDLTFLYEEAQEGFVGKIVTAIKKIIEAIKEFFSKVKDKIIAIFSRKEVEDNIVEMEKKLKLNPFAKNKKVETVDENKLKVIVNKYISSIKEKISRIKSGGEVADEEISDAHESFIKQHAMAIGATVAITSAAAIALLKSRKKKTTEDAKANEEDSLKIANVCKKIAEAGTGLSSKAAAQLTTLAKHASKAYETATTTTVNLFTGLFDSVKSLFKKKGAETPEDPFTESTSDIFNESADDNNSTDALFKEFGSLF